MDTSIILGQGIAGSTLAWMLHRAGHTVHIVDRGEERSASRIAAGLITPITGRRCSKSEDFDVCLTTAEYFYRSIEETVMRRLLDQQPALRYFRDHQEREYFLNERASLLGDEVELIPDGQGSIVGLRMLNAARLRVTDYLNSTRDYFAGLGQYHRADVNVTTDIVLDEEGVRLLNPAIAGVRLFFCQGFQKQTNPWFPGIPDAPSRGEILSVRIPGRTDQQVIHRGYWLAPAGPDDSNESLNQYIVGATYDRENLESRVTDHGREELEHALREITTVKAEITGHAAAIRAGTRNRRPICEVHAEFPQLAVLNGLGSKGALLAPLAAARLIAMVSIAQSTKPGGQQKRKSLTTLAHNIVRRAIQPGDKVADATAGNGYDTLFLVRCTGPSGSVISVDIQDSAIVSTRARLEAEGHHGVQLLVADHSVELRRLEEEQRQFKVIMFNLGYLPGGNKQQTTSPSSTVMAITSGLNMLSSGGVITVIAYRGHPGGQQEAQAVQDLAGRQDSARFTVDVIPGSDDNHESPILFVFRKK